MSTDTLKPIDMTALRPIDEVRRMGEEIYERDIRHSVEVDRHGECVAIDINSGRWAIAEGELEAADLLREERPDAIDVWMIRVGCRALFRIGGSAVGAAE